MLLLIQLQQLFGPLVHQKYLSVSVHMCVDGMCLCVQWCSFILSFLSERECKHGPLAKLHQPQCLRRYSVKPQL